MTDEEFAAWQKARVAEEVAKGEPLFMGLPDRWYEEPGPKWRCPNGHVSKRYLKSEELGDNVCLACYRFVGLTFPEDEELPGVRG